MIRALILRGDLSSALDALTRALTDFPKSTELRRAHAGVLQQTGRMDDTEVLLRTLLAEDPGDAGSAFSLAQLLKEQGRMAGAATIFRSCFSIESNRGNANLAIAAIELLDSCDRKHDAAEIAESAIAANPEDPRLHAYAGMLEIQLGEFERARQHYLFAIEHDEQAWEWHVPIGLSSAQRYKEATHPDLALFQEGLRRNNLSELAQAELHFSVGKAHDDLGDYAEAARYFREGNSIAHRLTKWSRDAWRKAIDTRLADRSVIPPLKPSDNFIPIFVVGMPRSGTTLLAELLSRYPDVRNRGELPWIARSAQHIDSGNVRTDDMLASAATMYIAHSRQDDAADARWFIDKQPLNFRYVDLILAMFPQAKIVHCRRDPRDTALSLWTQCFLEDVQGYAYDFDDIAMVMRDEQKLMMHWHLRHPNACHVVWYEDMVANPSNIVAALTAWIGIPPLPLSSTSIDLRPTSSISTASLWQARQPVNTLSIGRWQHYISHVPELLRLPGYLQS
jgi:Sulfotransferase family/Tetratricopeptide repeat